MGMHMQSCPAMGGEFDRITETCVMQHLRKTARGVTQLYEDSLREVGLTAGQFSTLVAVARNGTVALTPLAEELGMDRTTLTRALAPMERNGWVHTEISAGDARVRTVALTEEGRDLLSRATTRWQAAQDAALKRIGVNAWVKIRPALRDLVK
jgi:DNA-binding MarR family transcriptional regulator